MTTRLIVIYDQPDDVEAFFKHYEEVHTPLVKKTPGLQRLLLNRISGDVSAVLRPMRQLPRWTIRIAKPSTPQCRVPRTRP